MSARVSGATKSLHDRHFGNDFDAFLREQFDQVVYLFAFGVFVSQTVMDLIVGEETAIPALIEQAAQFVRPFGRVDGYAGNSHSVTLLLANTPAVILARRRVFHLPAIVFCFRLSLILQPSLDLPPS